MNRSFDKKDHVLIGEIVGVHGIKGTNRVLSYAESLSLYKPGSCILVREKDGRENKREIQWVKPHTGTALISFKGIGDRSQAEELIGANLFIRREVLPDLDEDTHYWMDLIGIEVYTAEEEYLGRIESIIETGSNDVYVVKDSKSENEVLIPALASVVLDIDIRRKRMQVELPVGLI